MYARRLGYGKNNTFSSLNGQKCKNLTFNISGTKISCILPICGVVQYLFFKKFQKPRNSTFLNIPFLLYTLCLTPQEKQRKKNSTCLLMPGNFKREYKL